MITMTCKCGTASLKFDNLSAKDFPNGWEADCCSEAKEKEPDYWEDKALEKVLEALPTTEGLPDLTEEDVAEIAEQVGEAVAAEAPAAKPKKRGRQPRS